MTQSASTASSRVFYSAKPEGLLLGPDRLSELDRRVLTTRIWDELVQGCDDPETFVESYRDADIDIDTGITEAEARDAFAQGRAARVAQQRSWPESVRVTNLMAAFAALEERGVLARADFTCCGTCGHYEIGSERTGAEPDKVWLGYVFFHSQATERLRERGDLYLGHGLFTDPDEDAGYDQKLEELVGTVVVPTLREHGLEVTWEGDSGRNIHIHNAHWYAPLS